MLFYVDTLARCLHKTGWCSTYFFQKVST